MLPWILIWIFFTVLSHTIEIIHWWSARLINVGYRKKRRQDHSPNKYKKFPEVLIEAVQIELPANASISFRRNEICICKLFFFSLTIL